MSGGVDSSVAAALLRAQGYDVVGATMKLFCRRRRGPRPPCCSLDSVNDARRVCESLGIPHYVLNLEDASGATSSTTSWPSMPPGARRFPACAATPSPSSATCCARPTRSTRRYIATGHYARVVDGACTAASTTTRTRPTSCGASTASVVSRLLLPVGHQTKPETRAVARELGLLTWPRSRRVARDLLRPRRRLRAGAPARAGRRCPRRSRRGPSSLVDGRVVGEHEGYARYTVGQRRGLPGGSGADVRGGDPPRSDARWSSGRARRCWAAALVATLAP
jgi:tRNA-uridine 2-sulfurtransferase